MSDVGGPGSPGGPRPQPSGGQSQGGNAAPPAGRPAAQPRQPPAQPAQQNQPQQPVQPTPQLQNQPAAVPEGRGEAARQPPPQGQPAPPGGPGGSAPGSGTEAGRAGAPATATPQAPADSVAPSVLRAAAEASQARPAAPAPLPEAIARLPAGRSFEAVVVGRTEAGATLLDTGSGRIAAFTASNLPAGARVTLVIASAPPVPGSAATASIVSVEGQALPASRFAVLAGLIGGGTVPLLPQSAPVIPPAPLPVGAVVLATLLGRPTVAALNALPDALASGATAGLRVLSVQSPALSAVAGAPAQGAATSAATVRGGTPPAPVSLPGGAVPSTGQPGFTLSSGGAPQALPAGAPTPVMNPAAPAGTAAAPVLTTLVVGKDGSGQTLVRANGMVLVLGDRTPLPLGATLRLEVLPAAQQPPPPLAGAPAVRTDPVLALSHTWPALNEIVEVLRHSAPAVANQFLGATIPAANGQLLANVMTFLFGMQMASPRSWLGPQVVQALERAGRGDLVRRLGDDFGRAARLAQEPSGGDWRTFLIPFLDGAHLQQIRMYLRDHRHEAEEGQDEPGQRMIVDLDLTRLGAMQLDGLFRERSFDLLIRTHSPLPDEARRDLGAIFEESMRETGLHGTIGFHVMRAFPVRPLEEVAGTGGHGVVA